MSIYIINNLKNVTLTKKVAKLSLLIVSILLFQITLKEKVDRTFYTCLLLSVLQTLRGFFNFYILVVFINPASNNWR